MDAIKVFKATVSTSFGKLIFAVLSTEHDAKRDILTAVQTETKNPFGLFRVGEVKKSSRKILSSMSPVKSCTCEEGHWAFCKRA